MNVGDMLQKAKEARDQFERLMQELRVDAEAGGGMVKVKMNGQKQILSLAIDPELVRGGDVEMLRDLVMGAVNQASRQVDEQLHRRVASLAGGLGLPGI